MKYIILFVSYDYVILFSLFSHYFQLFPHVLESHRLLSFGGDGLHPVGVPDDNVGIGAHCNPALAWIKVEDFSSVGRSDCHKLVFVHLPHGLKERILNLESVFNAPTHTHRRYINPHHSFVPDESHPLFNPVGPLWDQSEVIFTNRFLGSVVSTVSTTHNLEVPTVQTYI